MDDAELRTSIEAYIAANPLTTRGKIVRQFNTSVKRITRLEREGLTLPMKLNKSIGATLGRKAGGWGDNFKI